MSNKTQLNIRVDPSTKEDWESFVEDKPGMSSLTALIRRSVSQYIHQDEKDEDGNGGVDEDLFINEFEELRDEIMDIKNSTKTIQREALTHEDVVSATEAGVEIYWSSDYHDQPELADEQQERYK